MLLVASSTIDLETNRKALTVEELPAMPLYIRYLHDSTKKFVLGFLAATHLFTHVCLQPNAGPGCD